jgi:two-component system chemotaxis response regulator CheY
VLGVKHILLIDDDLFFSKALGQFLIHCGYQVTTAHNGEVGLNKFHADPADLVIADLVMPGKSGLDIIAELQAQDPQPKLIVISGGEERNLFRARQLGVEHTFSKPFNTEEVLEVIEAELQGSHQSGHPHDTRRSPLVSPTR